MKIFILQLEGELFDPGVFYQSRLLADNAKQVMIHAALTSACTHQTGIADMALFMQENIAVVEAELTVKKETT
jgi:hypothetical protein